jgi:hypothetical protein
LPQQPGPRRGRAASARWRTAGNLRSAARGRRRRLSQAAAGGGARKQRARARARSRKLTCLTTPSRKSFSSRSLAPSSAHSFGRWRMSVPLTLTAVFGRAGILAPDARRSRPAPVPWCPAEVPGGRSRSPAPLSFSRRRACAVWIRARDMPWGAAPGSRSQLSCVCSTGPRCGSASV